MRHAWALAALLLLGAAPLPRPQRIMSLDQCDDVRLLMLVPRGRIASITYLGHDAAAALLPPGADAGVAINHGTAEEIARQRPDLIIGTPFSAGAARRLARETGARLLELPDATSLADIRRDLRAIGRAVGEPVRAERLVAGMDAELARLAATAPARPRRVVLWSGDGSGAGRDTLAAAILAAAGARDVAAGTRFDLEQLIAARPEALLLGTGAYAQPSLHQAAARHPLIGRLFARRQIAFPAAAFACGVPQAALAAARLRAALARLP